MTKPPATITSPVAMTRAGAEAGGEHRAAGRHGDEHDRQRQQREAGLERRVAATELQVLRGQEEEAEHHEERDGDDARCRR